MIVLELTLFFFSTIIISIAIAGFGSLLSSKTVNNFPSGTKAPAKTIMVNAKFSNVVMR